MNSLKKLIALIIIFACIFSSCEDNDSKLVSCFNYSKNGATVNFNSNCSSKSVGSYDWDFGDGATSINPNPTHTYVNSGSYEVTLRVTGGGEFNTSVRTITVEGNVCRTCTPNVFMPSEEEECGTESEMAVFCADCIARYAPSPGATCN